MDGYYSSSLSPVQLNLNLNLKYHHVRAADTMTTKSNICSTNLWAHSAETGSVSVATNAQPYSFAPMKQQHFGGMRAGLLTSEMA